MDKEFTEIDLQNAWTSLKEQKFEDQNLDKNQIMDAIKSKSKLNISSLKKSLKLKADCCFSFVFLFIIIALLNFDYDRSVDTNLDSYFHLLFAFIYAVGTFILYRRYNKMDSRINSESNLLSSLKTNKEVIKSALLVERIWGILAMLLVYIFYFTQWTFEASSPTVLMKKIGLFFTITVIIMFLAEWANKRKFGSKIKELEEDIIRLELLG